MEDDSFRITEENHKRLILDLLIRITAENYSLRTTLLSSLSEGDPNKLKELTQEFQSLFVSANLKLRALIFEHYGNIDLNDILNPES